MKKIVFSILLMLFSLNASAFSSFAGIKEYITQTAYASWNYPTQKEADLVAIEGCKTQAKQTGVPEKNIKQCKVFSRGKTGGYGAFTCGETSCGVNMGSSERQNAIDEAYKTCSEHTQNCNSEDIRVWEDTKGFKITNRTNIDQRKNCIPTTAYKRCTSQCLNGSCVVTYENGCKINVQVSQEWNSMTNQWEFPSPQC